jgi:hypothetical protein
MSLHRSFNWNYVAGWNGWSTFVYCPSFMERLIRACVESFWRGSLAESIGDIRTEDHKIFNSRGRRWYQDEIRSTTG